MTTMVTVNRGTTNTVLNSCLFSNYGRYLNYQYLSCLLYCMSAYLQMVMVCPNERQPVWWTRGRHLQLLPRSLMYLQIYNYFINMCYLCVTIVPLLPVTKYYWCSYCWCIKSASIEQYHSWYARCVTPFLSNSTGSLRQKATVHGTNCNRSFFNGVWSSKVSFITY